MDPAADAPAVFWVADPVEPGETVLLAGHHLSGSSIELQRLANGDPGDPIPVPSPACDHPWQQAREIVADGAAASFRLPREDEPGIYGCRVVQPGGQTACTINAPDPWWMQGDHGSSARPGGWLRVLGRCLSFGGRARIALRAADGRLLNPPTNAATMWSVAAALPVDMAPGVYEVWLHNGLGGPAGWRCTEMLTVAPAATLGVVLNVRDFGAEPDHGKDCTPAIVAALERLWGLGGGTLYFPRGRYRINGNLRSGMWIASPLRVPDGVTLRGESRESVSLYWPDRDDPLPCLIECGSTVTIEELTLYAQGRHRSGICGSTGTRIHRVRIRMNAYYSLSAPGRLTRGRNNPESTSGLGSAIELTGAGVAVTECDILHSGVGVTLKHATGALICDNEIHAGAGWCGLFGGERVIVERNSCRGAHLTASGGCISLYYGAQSARHYYVADNVFEHFYGNDRETLTLDGHGTAYCGPVSASAGKAVQLAGDPIFGTGYRDALEQWQGTTLYILSGRGAGQYRNIVACDGRAITLDRPWAVDPDAASVVVLGKFNGNHLFIRNVIADSGYACQLYPPNCGCIVAENVSRRAGGYMVGGRLAVNTDGRAPVPRAEPCWFHLLLDNHVVEGNGWGGGEEFDFDINERGGESALHVWGDLSSYSMHSSEEPGREFFAPLAPEALAFVTASTRESEVPSVNRWHAIRRHRADGASSIRISGAVRDMVIEGCDLRDVERGVRIDRGAEDEPGVGFGGLSGGPAGLRLHENRFTAVQRPIADTRLNCAGAAAAADHR